MASRLDPVDVWGRRKHGSLCGQYVALQAAIPCRKVRFDEKWQLVALTAECEPNSDLRFLLTASVLANNQYVHDHPSTQKIQQI